MTISPISQRAGWLYNKFVAKWLEFTDRSVNE